MLNFIPLLQLTRLSDIEAGLQHCRVESCPPQLPACRWLRFTHASLEQVPTLTLLLPLLSSVHPSGNDTTFVRGMGLHESSRLPEITFFSKNVI